MPRILTLDAALATCSAGIVADGVVEAEAYGGADGSAALPMLVQTLLAGRPAVECVAVTIGPGSFTGLRAALALAHGIALGAGVPVLGVTVGAALRHLCPANRTLWTAIDSKRGRVFLERDGSVTTLALTALPFPDQPIAVAGDAAIRVAARLAALDAPVQLLDARRPTCLGIALAAARGETRAAQPLYADPPEARPGPPGRPAPV